MKETSKQLQLLSSGQCNYLATSDRQGLMIVQVDQDLKQVGTTILRGSVRGNG